MKRWFALLLPLLLTGQMWPNPGPGHASYSAATPVTQILVGGSTTGVAASLTRYGSPQGVDGNNALSSTEAPVEQIFLAGTISKLYVTLQTDLGSTGSHTMVVTVNVCSGEAAEPCTASALTCTITGSGGTDKSCNDTTHSVTVSDGDRVSVSVVTSAGTTTSIANWGMQWVGTNSNESMLIGAQLPTNNSNTNCFGLMGGIAVGSSTCTDAARVAVGELAIFPTSTFSVTKMYARSVDAITSGCRRITLQKESSDDTTFQIDLTDGTTKSDTTGTVTFTTGQSVEIESDPSSTTCPGTGSTTPTQDHIAVTLALSESSQKFMLPACGGGYTSSATRFGKASGTSSASATESVHAYAIPAFTIEDIAAEAQTAPGAGTSWAINFRDDGASVTGTCTIADTGTTCTADPSAVVAAASLVNWQAAPTGATASSELCYSLAGKP